MTVDVHEAYEAYIPGITMAEDARIVLLKAEVLNLCGTERTYVDAIVGSVSALSAIPFIGISQQRLPVFPKCFADASPATCAALSDPIARWIAQKGTQAHLVADVFHQHALLLAAIEAVKQVPRALPGLSAYDLLFTEAERYANVTPFVHGRSVVDFNPGFGYGANTLRHVASRISAEIPQFARSMHDAVLPVNAPAQVALWLDADPAHLEAILDRCRTGIEPGGTAVISVRDANARDILASMGACVTAMHRPGADALGALNEWLAVFPYTSAPSAAPARSSAACQHTGRKLKILFALRPSAESIFGGDVVQVRQTVEALRRRGHTVELSTRPQLESAGFDIVHLSNLTAPEETLAQAESVRNFTGPVVLMPIFIDHADETVWGMATSLAAFVQSGDERDLHEKLNLLERRALSIPNLQAPPGRNDIVPGYTQAQRRIVELVDFVIANAHSEMHRIYRYLACDVPYAVAPSAVDARLYGAHRREEFVEAYGFADFVVMPGRYEPRKNQLLLFQALRDLDYPLVCVGSNRDAAFAQAVRAFRPAGATYFAHLAEDALAALFAAARIVVAPSWDEVVSLTSLNGAISEASLVLTRNSYEHEYFQDDAEYCDPASVASIRSALQRAWNTHDERRGRRERLAERVRLQYNWDASAAATEAAYYRALSSRRRKGGSDVV